MTSKRFFTCKHPNEIHELMVIHPYLLVVFAGLVSYCHSCGYPAPVITCIGRTPAEDDAVGAESDSHSTLRAFDVRSSTYTAEQIKDICDHMNREYADYAAVSAKTGKKILALHHKVDGNSFHFHIQIHGRYRLPVFKGMDK
jgi:hypothetical protein